MEARAHPNAPAEFPVTAPTPILPDQKVRLAIGGLGLPDDSMNRQLADLLTAELSRAQGLELVDRQSFDKVLRELELNLSGLVRAKDAVRVGKLLRAEWFLLGSTASSGASNAVIARIVDTQTGVMRDVGVFPFGDASPALAAKLAEFVRTCRRAGSDAKPGVFLAVGTFQDLSVNNRLGEFPAQMRAQLTKAYQGSGVAMLEREYVNALLQEVRLDLAGLTDTSASALPRMQSAFWLVDGAYQSYETSEYEVELALNIKRIFGRSTTNVVLRGKLGQPLLAKVKAEIDSALSARAASIVPTRLSEARAQMDTGKESFRPKTPGAEMVNLEWLLTGPFGVVADEPRRRDLEEAIRAFQTVLLLEPTNREAKVYLAAASLSLGKEDEGRRYCREILDEPSKDKWVLIAQETLTRSLYRASSEERGRWLQPAALQAANPSARPVGGESGGEAVGAAAQQNDRRQEVAEELLFATIAKFDAGHFYSGAIGMDDFAAAFGRDQAAAARRLVELYPKMKANAPNSVPYLLASLVTLQVDTNAPVVAEFEQALAGWAEHAEKVPKRMASIWDHIDAVTRWSAEHKLPVLAAKIMEAKARVQETAPGGNSILSNEDRMELAFGYKAAGRWKDALKVFESYGNMPLAMGGSGPWGRAWTVVLTSREAAECRKHLGLPSPIDPREFDIGKSLLCLHAIGYRNEVEFHLHQVGAIAATADGLWVGFGGKLMRMDAKLGTNFVSDLPVDNGTPITCACPTPSEIWLGTHGEGLIGCDLASHKCVQLTVKDGLLMDFIMSLQLIGDTLWIGYGGSYGAPSGGGLGKLDLRTRQSTSFAASLAEGQAAERKPPRVPVTGITAGAGGDVWFIAGNNLRRYRSRADVWEPPALFEHIDALAFQAEDVLVGLGPDIGSSTAFGLRVLAPKDGQWKRFPEMAGLPPGVNALKVDGGNVWVGGHSFVALVDPAQDKVLKFAYVPARTVEQIELGGGYLWAQCEKHLYRTPLSATR